MKQRRTDQVDEETAAPAAAAPAPAAGPLAAAIMHHQAELLATAAAIVATVVAGRRVAGTNADTATAGVHATAPPAVPWSETPVVGAFVTLRNGSQLRACRGCLGTDQRLVAAVRCAAHGACADDRFAPLETHELTAMSLEISLLFARRIVTGGPRERLDAVRVGRHGIILTAAGKSGLLLPAVAREQQWDAAAFLAAGCRKAGLAASAWTDPGVVLETFEAVEIHGRVSV